MKKAIFAVSKNMQDGEHRRTIPQKYHLRYEREFGVILAFAVFAVFAVFDLEYE